MPTDTNDPIQQQLIAARRKQILDAAVRVFADKGFHRATIRDIAQAAGIADGPWPMRIRASIARNLH